MALLHEHEKTIADDLVKCQGKPLDIGGYYHPDPKKLSQLMRPSKVFNDVLDMISKWSKPKPLRKPKWGKVEKLQPEAKGVNLMLKCVSISEVKTERDDGSKIWEAVCGDETGVITIQLKDEALVAICKEGASLRLQNAKVVMFKGFIRVAIDKWAVLKTADETLDFTVKKEKDVSAVEYELSS